MSEDEPSEFLGAMVTEVTVTDTALRTYDDLDMLEAGGVMFVNVVTDRGTLQFVCYNAHNGYYGHEAKVISEQVTQEKHL